MVRAWLYGLRVRVRGPGKYVTGTRVANPMEGRTGTIQSFNTVTRVYTLVFHDGHRDEVPEAEVEQFVIQPNAEEEERAAHAAAYISREVLQLINQTIVKTSRSYEGEELVLQGHIVSWDDDKERYRVVYTNGMYEDMTLDAVKANVAGTDGAQPSKRSADELERDATLETFAKKVKWSPPEGNDAAPVPLFQQKFPARKTAYVIVRKVLSAVLTQNAVKKMRTDKQVTILNNDDVSPKLALSNFIEAGGLICLQKVLVMWMKNPVTHPGALLVLKILAVLPGLSADAIVASGIGKTLRGIARVSLTTTHVSRVLGDMSEWIIRRWKSEVLPKSLSASAKKIIESKSIDTKSASAEVNVANMPTKPGPNQAMTNRLRELLRVSEPIETEAEPEIRLPQFNSLGSEDAKNRQGRKIVILETLIERAEAANATPTETEQNEDVPITESVIVSHGNEEVHPIWRKEGGELSVGRLRFGRPSLLLYQKHVAVSKLRDTVRSKFAKDPMFQSAEMQRVTEEDSFELNAKEMEREVIPKLPMPNKLTRPAKSILRKVSAIQASSCEWS
ncbi:TPA: hypothetical protein N0F65_012707 [Lagenidium giganteum]|uniref:TFIIS N-terminal domain-containing protein n=1 Tax=Lagenidium giganteum TaxID=4803 RepID=A0AAV2YBI2_9STRA|nr:TPA: hypothetical protein N0F65_012707 [Lagenidium giganteum]